MRRPATAMAVALVVVSIAAGCSNRSGGGGVSGGASPDDFCTELSTHYKLKPLLAAIHANDGPAITRNLAELRSIQDTAPKELFDDVRKVLDVMEQTVRAMTPATGSDGDHAPIDPGTLTIRLEAIKPNAQHITEYADRNCGIKL